MQPTELVTVWIVRMDGYTDTVPEVFTNEMAAQAYAWKLSLNHGVNKSDIRVESQNVRDTA